MKKLFLLAALVVVAGASFAFLPKQQNAAQVGSITVLKSYTNFSDYEVITALGGEPQYEEIKPKGSQEERKKSFYKAVNARLSNAKNEGWSIATSYSHLAPGTGLEITYVLEKR